jgi:hypothetical protein
MTGPTPSGLSNSGELVQRDRLATFPHLRPRMAFHVDQPSDQVHRRDPVLRRSCVRIRFGEHVADVAEQRFALDAVVIALDLTTQPGGFARPLRPMASRGFGDGQERAPIVRVAVEKPIGRLRIGGLNLRGVVERPARSLGRESSRAAVQSRRKLSTFSLRSRRLRSMTMARSCRVGGSFPISAIATAQ